VVQKKMEYRAGVSSTGHRKRSKKSFFAGGTSQESARVNVLWSRNRLSFALKACSRQLLEQKHVVELKSIGDTKRKKSRIDYLLICNAKGPTTATASR